MKKAADPQDVLGRTLPANLEAERSVLGAVLMDGEAFDRTADVVGSGEFFKPGHRLIYAAMAGLSEAGKPIDMVTLREALGRAGHLDDAGGPAYLAALADGMPRGVNVAHYAAIVAEKARLRAAILTANALSQQAYEAEAPAAEIAADAADRLSAIGGGDRDWRAVAFADILAEGMEALERAVARGTGAVTGATTGFPELDEQTGGLQPSDLVLVAARTSMGKTALAMNIVRHVGATDPTLVFSLEMSRAQLFLRMLAGEAGVDSHRLRAGFLREEDWARLAHALGTLRDLKVFVDDTGGIGVREVRARARQVKAAHGLGLVVVDYIQLMRGRGTFDNRSQEIGTISRGLKSVAKELDVPVLALAQLNRQSEGRDGRKARRPQLSDLAESGSLENDADCVLLIWREDGKDDEEGLPVAEVIVAKSRNGPIGTIRLNWNPQLVRFENRLLSNGRILAAL